jgi:hypothetical protein
VFKTEADFELYCIILFCRYRKDLEWRKHLEGGIRRGKKATDKGRRTANNVHDVRVWM